MKHLHGLLVLIAHLLSTPVIAQKLEPHGGCDCPTMRVDDAYCASHAVFEAIALGSDTVHADAGIKPIARNVIEGIPTRFKVTKVLKGDVGDLVTVQSATGSDDSGYHFRPGVQYLLFATEEEEFSALIVAMPRGPWMS